MCVFRKQITRKREAKYVRRRKNKEGKYTFEGNKSREKKVKESTFEGIRGNRQRNKPRFNRAPMDANRTVTTSFGSVTNFRTSGN